MDQKEPVQPRSEANPLFVQLEGKNTWNTMGFGRFDGPPVGQLASCLFMAPVEPAGARLRRRLVPRVGLLSKQVISGVNESMGED